MMKKLFLALALPVCLIADVSFENNNSVERLEHQMERANKSLERIISLLEQLVKEAEVEVWDIDGKRVR